MKNLRQQKQHNSMMRVSNSPLKCVSWLIIQSSCEFKMRKNDKHKNHIKVDHTLDITFNHKFHQNDKNQFLIELGCKIRPILKHSGYAIDVSSINHFQLLKEIQNKDIYMNLIVTSALTYAIAKIRAFLENMTSYYDNKYHLPLIDIIDLIKQKQKQIKNGNN